LETVVTKSEKLIQFPEMGQCSTKNEQVRKILIGKYNALYYRFDKTKVELLDLFDQRQDPNNKKY
jgi:plasmid stabilization system protein ParE